MTCAYAMGATWLGVKHRCGARPKHNLGDWFALMTGQPTQRSQHTFGPWVMFDAPPPFGPRWPGGGRGWRGPKARRGDVRSAILGVLAEHQLNGYQIIQEIAARSGGAWKPSPGSIYPTLQQLEDEGLVRAESLDGRRAFTLTEDGRTWVVEHADEVAAPWQTMNGTADADESIKPLIGQVAAAMWQIVAVGTPEQHHKARAAMLELRKKLYGILSDDDTSEN